MWRERVCEFVFSRLSFCRNSFSWVNNHKKLSKITWNVNWMFFKVLNGKAIVRPNEKKDHWWLNFFFFCLALSLARCDCANDILWFNTNYLFSDSYCVRVLPYKKETVVKRNCAVFFSLSMCASKIVLVYVEPYTVFFLMLLVALSVCFFIWCKIEKKI